MRAIPTSLCLLLLALPPSVSAAPPSFVLKWGTPGTGAGQFDEPTGIAVNPLGTVVFVADKDNARVQKFNPVGNYVSAWSSGTAPWAVDMDAAGNVYVADYIGNKIRKYDNNGGFLLEWGTLGAADGQLSSPFGIAVSADDFVSVGDSNNARIQKFTTSGAFVTKWGQAGTGNGEFGRPVGIDTDANGNVFVVDLDQARVQKFTATGTYLTQWGAPGNQEGEFSGPRDLTLAANGSVYVADTGNHRIQRFSNSGDFSLSWGSPGAGDGQFNFPASVDVDVNGFIYVADFNNARVQRFHDDGPVVAVEEPHAGGPGLRLDVQPNPFRSNVDVSFALDRAGLATVHVFDVTGERIRTLADSHFPVGRHAVAWNGRDDAGRPMSPGIYLIRLVTGGVQVPAKALLIE